MTVGDSQDSYYDGQPDYASPTGKMCPFLSGANKNGTGYDKCVRVKCRPEFCKFWDEEKNDCKFVLALNKIIGYNNE